MGNLSTGTNQNQASMAYPEPLDSRSNAYLAKRFDEDDVSKMLGKSWNEQQKEIKEYDRSTKEFK